MPTTQYVQYPADTTPATGTVTSVALAAPSSILSVSGSPVTTTGTLTLSLATQTANKVWAGPTSGGAATPTFRSLVAADLPLTFGNLTDVGTDGITVTGGTGAVIGSGTSLSQHVADSTHNGYLSSTDWSTFNGKQAAGNYITALTGDVTAAGPGSVASTLAKIQGTTVSGTTGTGNVVFSAAPTITGLLSTTDIYSAGTLKVGTASTIFTAQELSSFLNSISAVPTSTPTAIAVQTLLTSNSASTTAQLRAMDIQTQRVLTANVTDTQSILNANFRVVVNVDTGHTYTNSGATGLTPLNIQNLSLTGGGAITATYSGISYNADTTLVSGYKTGLRFQSFSGGTFNALIADNITHGVSAGGIQFSGAYANNLGTGLTTVGSLSSGAISGTGLSLNVVTKTTTYTATSTDDLVLADTGSAWTLTLPAANASKKIFRVKKTTSDFNALTVSRAGSDTISDNGTTGLTSTTVNTIGEEIRLESDGSSVWYVSRTIPSVWVAYTPTYSAGIGTVSTQDTYWRRSGDSIQIKADFTCGTVAASVVSMTLPTGLTIDATKCANITSFGSFGITTSHGYCPLFLGNGNAGGAGTNLITFGRQDGSNGGLSSQNGTNIFTTGDRIAGVTQPIPITGWKG